MCFYIFYCIMDIFASDCQYNNKDLCIVCFLSWVPFTNKQNTWCIKRLTLNALFVLDNQNSLNRELGIQQATLRKLLIKKWFVPYLCQPCLKQRLLCRRFLFFLEDSFSKLYSRNYMLIFQDDNTITAIVIFC